MFVKGQWWLQVDSRAALAAAWQLDPAWLLRELSTWMRPSHRSALKDIWSTLRDESTRVLT